MAGAPCPLAGDGLREWFLPPKAGDAILPRFWPARDWDSGLWCDRAFWPEMDRQWPAMHSGVGQWTEMAMD